MFSRSAFFSMVVVLFLTVLGIALAGFQYRSKEIERMRQADEYYNNELFEILFYYHRTNKKEIMILLTDIEKMMREDGYSNVEIGLMKREASSKAVAEVKELEEYEESMLDLELESWPKNETKYNKTK